MDNKKFSQISPTLFLLKKLYSKQSSNGSKFNIQYSNINFNNFLIVQFNLNFQKSN